MKINSVGHGTDTLAREEDESDDAETKGTDWRKQSNYSLIRGEGLISLGPGAETEWRIRIRLTEIVSLQFHSVSAEQS